jgi:hypothetical protein
MYETGFELVPHIRHVSPHDSFRTERIGINFNGIFRGKLEIFHCTHSKLAIEQKKASHHISVSRKHS